MHNESLSARVVHAVQWRFHTGLVKVALQLVVSIFLARILAPKDFGLIAMAMIIIGFAEQFYSLGVGPAVIQLKDLTNSHVRTGFTISFLLGLGTTATLWCAAPIFGKLLGSTEVLPVLRIVSITFLFAGFGVIGRSLLIRKLNFKTIFVVDIVSSALGYALFSIVLALRGFGVWSLVFGSLAQTLINSFTLLIIARHSLIPRLRLKEASRLLSFGGLVSLNGILNYGATKVEYFIVGRILSTHTLGLYSFIKTLIAMPLRHFSGVLAEVLFPAFSQIQDQHQRLSRGYFLSMNITTLVCFPSLMVLAIVAPEMIRGIFGPKWVEASPVLQILCLSVALKSITRLAGPVVYATRNVHKEAIRQFIYLIILTISAVIGTRWGIEGVAVAVNIGSLALFCMNGQLALGIIGSSWKEFLINLRLGFAACFLVGIPLLAIRGILKSSDVFVISDLTIFAAMVFAAFVLYIGALFIIPNSWYGDGPMLIVQKLGLRLPLHVKNFLGQLFSRVVVSD